jgi:hypothetical protein
MISAWSAPALLLFVALSAGPAFSQADKPPAAGMRQVVPLTEQQLYVGWRASSILGQIIRSSTSSGNLGIVRNIAISSQGEISALVVESNDEPEFVLRIPWQRIDKTRLPNALFADLLNGRDRGLGLFAKADGSPDEFRVTAVIGDNARLQPGLTYGYVSDVIFTRDGKLLAVLVTRDAPGGGGTFAFGFPGTTGRWDPNASYYGLPYITSQHATDAAIRVDRKRFQPGDRDELQGRR